MSVTAAEVLELVAERDRLDARLSTAVAEFDEAELWDLDAATSMKAWLRDHARMTNGQAHRLVVNARRLRAPPATHEAFVSGALSAGHVGAIFNNGRKEVHGIPQPEDEP